MGCTNSVEKKPNQRPNQQFPADNNSSTTDNKNNKNNNGGRIGNEKVTTPATHVDPYANNRIDEPKPQQPPKAEVVEVPAQHDAADDAADKDAEYQALLKKKAENKSYKMNGPKLNPPTHDYEAIPCFKTGLLYRCVAGNVWSFYNDTQEYEMFVNVTCGLESNLTALGTTKMITNSDGTMTFSSVIYPGDTEPFWEGKFDGFKCALSAKPLSNEYRNKMIEKADKKVQQEVKNIRNKTVSQDPETVLAACLKTNIPFVDPSFKPGPSSLFREGVDSRKVAGAAWMRPTDYLSEDLHTHIVKFREIEANDIDQGQLGDCWLLSAIASIAEYPVRIERLFNHPSLSNETASKEEALGAYRLTLNVNGWWTNVIVDDYLPTIGGKPCFAKNIEDPAELWAALMEKAFAKVFGSYSAITGGDALVALQDMTGFPVSRFDTEWKNCLNNDEKSEAFFKQLVAYDENHFLTIVNTPGFDTAAYAGGKNDAKMEEKYKAAGLALGHAYTLIDVRHFPEIDNLQLCKIRNPWGNGTEWTGVWSDKCDNWSKPQYRTVAEGCGMLDDANKQDDGTFWMTFEDVQKYFDGGGVCFYRNNWFDYRIKGAFADAAPNVALEVTVSKPVEAYITMSQRDKRMMLAENKAYKYGAIMISVCKKAEGAAGRYVVHLNSNTDPENPTEKYTFNFSRDHAMKYTFAPSPDPYLVIPRIHGNTGVCNFVLGFLSDTKVGDGLTIRFRQIDASSKVYQNFPKFPYDATATPMVEAEYQFVDPKEFKSPTPIRAKIMS